MNATPNENPGSRVVRKIRIRAMLFLVLAVIAGTAAVFLVKVYLDKARASSGPEGPDTSPVVVAAADLPVAQVVEERHLEVVSFPSGHVPAGAFGDPEEVVGRSLRQAVVEGEPILAPRLADQERGRGLAAILREGTRAMAVEVNQVIGVAGFVQPGDYVDVITTMTPDEETRRRLASEAARMSKIILQNIRVLAVGEHLDTEGRKPVKVQVVTLEVTPEESERLALASEHGTIQLTMRSRVDQLTTPTVGIAPLDLLSPEGGAPLVAEKSEDEDAESDAERERRARARRYARRRRQRPEPEEKEVEEEKESAPVVEILRGTRKVEERELRPSADSR